MARCEDCIHYGVCMELEKYRDPLCFTDTKGEFGCSSYFPADVAPRAEGGAECPICHGTGRIGTTDWLTRHLSKKQLAEEKAKAIAEHEGHIKAEVAREIFEEIEKAVEDAEFEFGTFFGVKLAIAELKKKYTESKDDT